MPRTVGETNKPNAKMAIAKGIIVISMHGKAAEKPVALPFIVTTEVIEAGSEIVCLIDANVYGKTAREPKPQRTAGMLVRESGQAKRPRIDPVNEEGSD